MDCSKLPSSIVNPYGFGMAFCLEAMNDCRNSGDTIMYNSWLQLGLKYTHDFLDCNRNDWHWMQKPVASSSITV